MRSDLTDITLIVDRSGSMAQVPQHLKVRVKWLGGCASNPCTANKFGEQVRREFTDEEREGMK